MMKILAAKLSSNPLLSAFVYDKKGVLYIRSGQDDFIKGYGLQTTLEGACAKWGFSKLENPVEMRDGQDLYDNAKNFSLSNDGKVKYNQPLFQ